MREPKLIETFSATQAGFQPVLTKDSWQVAHLNYSPIYDLNHFDGLIAHQNGDRSFSLLSGRAVLLTSDNPKGTEFEIVLLKRGTSYNVPRNRAYKILMTAGSQIFVVEQANQHLVKPQNHPLGAVLLKEIRQSIYQILKPKS